MVASEKAMERKVAIRQVIGLLTGYMVTQALYVAAKLGVADGLRAGPLAVRSLASQLRVDEDALYRVLRALASVGYSPRSHRGRSSSHRSPCARGRGRHPGR